MNGLRGLSGLCDDDPAVADGFLLWRKVCEPVIFHGCTRDYTQITSPVTQTSKISRY